VLSPANARRGAPFAARLRREPAVSKSDDRVRMPRQIPFIIANEGCERFSFYGMRNILTPFLTTILLIQAFPDKTLRADAAKEVFHTFVMGVYFFPLLGGWIADRFFGKYNTILWFSLIYCAGNACLATAGASINQFYLGLFLISLGSGGIKPLVASFMGDQFDSRTKHLAKLVFDAFYWIINFGSFFASLLMPIFLAQLGPSWAFGIPGALMFVATIVFWIGRKQYVMVPVAPPNPGSFMRVVRTALLSQLPGAGRPGYYVAVTGVLLAANLLLLAVLSLVLPKLSLAMPVPWSLAFVPTVCLALVILVSFGGVGTAMQLERARGTHTAEAVDGVRAVLGILIVFALVTPFHSLFDQKASTWVLQGGDMISPAWDFDLGSWGLWVLEFQPAQMQALNPALVMVLIPFNNLVLYPWLRRRGWEPTSLRKMTVGIAFAGFAWILAGGIQLVIDGGDQISIMWQIAPYTLLTLGEVLVSATGLEFAYSQAPLAMKGVIMSFWNLTTTVGNLWVLLVNAGVRNEEVTSRIESTGLSETAFLMFFFAAFAFAAAFAFKLYVRRYKVLDHYRHVDDKGKAGPSKAEPLPEARVHKDEDKA
jgi:POT family proton-dependent oligopeptide transporter